MGQPIRVVAANQPRLMRELVLETIIEQPDIEIAAEILNEKGFTRIVDGTHPDFLIMPLDESGQRPALCDILLRRYPEMKIPAPERNVSMFFWASFDIHSYQVEASAAGILSTLRRSGPYMA